MNGMITTNENYDFERIQPKLKAYTTGKVVEKVSCKEKYVVAPTTELSQNGPLSGSAKFDKAAYEKGVREPRPTLVRELNGAGLKVALMDFGAKANIAHSLAERGCEVTVYPALTRCRRDYSIRTGRNHAEQRPRRPEGMYYYYRRNQKAVSD